MYKRGVIGTRKTAIVLAALWATAAALPAPAEASPTGLPPLSPARTLECDDAATGADAAPASAPGVGPFHMLGAGESGSHWNPATERFASKVPVVVAGSEPVLVRVPDRLAGRLALVYGGAGHRSPSREITFVPCARRTATFFPGGMLFTRREPISLLVQPDGWAKPKALRLGVFEPY